MGLAVRTAFLAQTLAPDGLVFIDSSCLGCPALHLSFPHAEERYTWRN